MSFAPADKLLTCVHCGLCLPACPTYAELGTEADSPRGRILLLRALEDRRLLPSAEVIAHLDGCLGCRACETACPSGVPYGELIEAARPALEAHRPRLQRFARRLLGRVLASRPARRLAFAPLRAIGGSRAAVAAARASAATAIGPWLAYAAAVPPAGARDALPEVVDASGPRRGTALYLAGCVAETLFPDTARATVALLARAGVRVLVPRAQGCCGALALHLGDEAGAARLARDLLRALPFADVDWAIPSAAGCGAFLREVERLLPDDALARRAAAIVRDPLALLAELGLPEPVRALRRRVAIHDPCHLAHAQGVRAEPRSLLAAIPGIELVGLADSDACCGSAGTYNLTEPAMASRLRERKLDRIAESGAEVVAAANPGCLLQIRAGAIARGMAVEVAHPIDLLARAHAVGEQRATGRPARPAHARAADGALSAVAAALAVSLAASLAACSGREGPAPPTATAAARSPSPAATPLASATPASSSETPADEPTRGATPVEGAPEDDDELLAARDRDAIRRAISDQIDALRRDDGAAAFAFAAPAIQELFGTPENFLRMVKSAYAPLYRPRDVRFAELSIVAGEVTQKVVVVDTRGRPATALYLMDRQPDGQWKILGCVIVPPDEMPT